MGISESSIIYIMNQRLIIQARQTGSLYQQFLEIKNKYVKLAHSHDLQPPESQLKKWKEIEQMFIVDINILPMDHLTLRRNILMNTIDNIMAAESQLRLRSSRKKQLGEQGERKLLEISPHKNDINRQHQFPTQVTSNPQYITKLQAIQELKKKCDELVSQNIKLQHQNQRLRFCLEKKAAFSDRYEQLLFDNSNFQIIKRYHKTTQTHHYSLHKNLHKNFLQLKFDKESVVKYVSLLQQKIVDNLPVMKLALQISNKSNQASKHQILSQKFLTEPIRSKAEEQKLGNSPASSKNLATSTRDFLDETSTRVNEIRKERKKVFEDDDLWNEVENMKL